MFTKAEICRAQLKRKALNFMKIVLYVSKKITEVGLFQNLRVNHRLPADFHMYTL